MREPTVQELMRRMLTQDPAPIERCLRCRQPISEVYQTREDLHENYMISWECMHRCAGCGSWRCGHAPLVVALGLAADGPRA